jgi:hypothetical protein
MQIRRRLQRRGWLVSRNMVHVGMSAGGNIGISTIRVHPLRATAFVEEVRVLKRKTTHSRRTDVSSLTV